MRFKIDLRLLGEAPISIPVNYQSEFSSWIHKMLHFQSGDFKTWLSEKKFLDASGEYRLYTFSDVFFSSSRTHDERLYLENDKASIIISFYAEGDIEPFILSLFREQEFKVGDSKGKTTVKVEKIEPIPQPDFNSKTRAVFTALSPLLIAEAGKGQDAFIAPDQKDFDKIFFKSLMFKYANLVKYMPTNQGALTGLNELKFKLIGKPRTKVIKIKTDTPHQKSVKGYLFDFEMQAPAELLRIGYNAGFGELNSIGFGCCQLKE